MDNRSSSDIWTAASGNGILMISRKNACFFSVTVVSFIGSLVERIW